MANNNDDRLIWNKFLKGDNQALRLIYLLHSNELFDYGCRFTVDRDLVKDCIQDVFCMLTRTRNHLSETDNIRLYLLKSLKRKIIFEIKKSHLQPQLQDDMEYKFSIGRIENIDNQFNDIENDKKQQLTNALFFLTEQQKEAIYLRYNLGLNYEEISYILNINYQSSRALIHRAIEKARQILHIYEKKMNPILLSIL